MRVVEIGELVGAGRVAGTAKRKQRPVADRSSARPALGAAC